MALCDIKNKNILLTGGATGMGAEFVQGFLKHGAKNIALLDVNEEQGKATTERLNKEHGNKVVFIKCDVSKEEDITKAFDAVVDKFKQVDVIVNNAGIMNDSEQIWKTASNVNWQGLVSFTLKAVSHMRKDEGGAGGTIVNVGSTTALNRFNSLPVYSGGKAAVLHFTQSLALEPFFETTGIRVLLFVPGSTNTGLLQNVDKKTYDPKIGALLPEYMEIAQQYFQTVESAGNAFIEMFKTGTNGSIWLSTGNKPAQDITAIMDRLFKEYEKVVHKIDA